MMWHMTVEKRYLIHAVFHHRAVTVMEYLLVETIDWNVRNIQDKCSSSRGNGCLGI